MVVPTGFSIPPAPYTLGLIVAIGIVGYTLWRLRPPVTEPLIVSFVPWMGFGASLHVIYQLGIAPDWIHPLLGTPAAYATTFVLAGTAWIVTQYARIDAEQGVTRIAITGIVLVSGTFMIIVNGQPVLRYTWPILGLVIGIGLTGISWGSLAYFFPDTTRTTGWAGLLVVLGQTIDGVSTAIGVDFLGFGERTPLARIILDIASALPVSDLIGVGWLFVLIKLVIALTVVRFLTELVRNEPDTGYLLLGVITAVGLGPGVHNLLLYLIP